MGSSKQPLHIGILSSPGLGHIIPVVTLANRLATFHNVSVTVFVITSGSSLAETEILKSANKSKMIDVVEIPGADISNLIDSNTKIVTQLCILVRETLHVVKSAIFAMKHLLDALIVKSPVYPVGPLIRHDQQIIDGNNSVLNWLDKQIPNSVLYISFGSGGTLSSKQLTELAFGLELSHQKFIWVVRPPSEVGADKSFFTTGNRGDNTPEYLPEGFLTRTKDFGLVIQMWTDQTRILSHPSVGGFLTHWMEF
ncbi:hypothetical protein MTR67_010178 [Solanum verrucosum]|uniref:Uncharacterized protein n=1 Tax=Solanum verrucosum TaxID=315347 RepID=A0AAF0TI32_SOLVR|nr:hypothetical protein MTR67_010178 [Solanum verrucosum]